MHKRHVLGCAALWCSSGIATALAQQLPPAAQGTASAETKISVKRFEVSGNTLLPQAEIDAVLSAHKGERTLTELNRAAAAVQASYAAAGYGGVAAFVPPQQSSDGTVTIRVIEGRLRTVQLTGNRQFGDANIRASLPGLMRGYTPRLTTVDTQIQLANENPAKQVQVLLQPGQDPGEVDAVVRVSEGPLQRLNVGLDNTGSERTGEHRASLGWQHANLFGLDHVLSTQFQTSVEKPSRVKVASVGYRVPFYAESIALDAFAAYSDVDGGTSATIAGDLQFTGRGRIVGGRISQYLPRLGDVDQRLGVGVEHRAYLNSCQISGQQPGACGTAGESVVVHPLTIDYSLQRGGEQPLSLSTTLAHNLRIGGNNAGDASFNGVRPGASASYTLVRVQASAGLPFGEGWQLQLRSSAQYSRDPLVPGEQFGLGGLGSTRGYREREVNGDRGVSASVELLAPDIARAIGWNEASVRLLAFADVGRVHNLRRTPCIGTVPGHACTQASVGAGARVAAGNLQARVFVGHALESSAQTGRHDTRIHFALSYSF